MLEERLQHKQRRLQKQPKIPSYLLTPESSTLRKTPDPLHIRAVPVAKKLEPHFSLQWRRVAIAEKNVVRAKLSELRAIQMHLASV